MKPVNVDIGLLWNETEITIEDLEHQYVVFESEGRLEEVHSVFPPLTVTVERTNRPAHVALRLAESLSPLHADKILEIVSAKRKHLSLDRIEAGRRWKINGVPLDARVWWPVIRLDSPQDAEPLMEELRRTVGLEPVGFSVVKLKQPPEKIPRYMTVELLGKHSSPRRARATNLFINSPDWKSSFKLANVPIGRGFHWERKESLEYRGSLWIRVDDGLTAINRLPLEWYLESAVGSEMRSDLPPAFSRAQAIAARSTVLATAGRHHYADGFDLCNDDHCQCYQGVKQEAEGVVEPVRNTAGKVLTFGDRVVDARYAKSCGGVSERYEEVWGAEGPDCFAVRPCGEFEVPDLRDDGAAAEFLRAQPPAFCNPDLHPYPAPWNEDPLFRWERKHRRKKLGELVERKTGKKVGKIRGLRSVRRGRSGRIVVLDIVGSDAMHRVYGELNIRRALSDSHLPSSFFVTGESRNEIRIIGGGWGHGVGMCQLGAAALAKSGRSEEEILKHYYPGSKLIHL